MPYQETDIDDFDCDILTCSSNRYGYCVADENVDSLTADSVSCFRYSFEKNKEYLINNKYGYRESDIPLIIDAHEEQGIAYKEIEKGALRLVLKTINDKSTLFRISRKGEEEYHFFSCIDGGVDYVHKSVRESDLFDR